MAINPQICHLCLNMPPIKKLAVVSNLYFYRNLYSREPLACVACKKPLTNSLVKIVDKIMFHENCNKLQPNIQNEVQLLQHKLKQSTLSLQNETQKVQQLTDANLKLFDEIKICNQLQNKIQLLEHRLEQTTLSLQNGTQKVKQITDANLKLLDEIKTCRQQQNINQKHKFDDFRIYEQKKISAAIRLRLLEFCRAEFGAALIIDEFTVSNFVVAVVNAIQNNPQFLFLWNLFYEQLSYALLCPKCFLNSSTLSHQELVETCKKHQAILVNFNGKYYGGIFIGYAPPDKNKAVIQWFEDNSFSVMDVDTCYKLSNLTVVPEDKSIEQAVIYNTRSTTKFWTDFPLLLSEK